MVPEIRKALAPHASKFIETLVSLTKQPLRLQVTRGAVQAGTFYARALQAWPSTTCGLTSWFAKVQDGITVKDVYILSNDFESGVLHHLDRAGNT